MSRKTPQGEGYTVRKDGRKVLKTKVLETEVEQLKRNYEDLQRQNNALRAKENLQLTLLDNYEVWLRRLNGLTAEAPLTLPSHSASADDSSSCMTAQLEERIQHLKQHLVLPLAAASPTFSLNSTSSQASAAATCSVPDATSAAAAVDAARAAAAAAGCSGNGDQGNNMARWFQSVTPEDVAAMAGFTVGSVAVRMRDVIRQLAVAHWGTVFEGSEEAAQAEYDLQEEMAKISISATISNEDVFVKVYGLNMETLQYEAPPPGHWMAVAKAINLTQAQTEAICRAYHDVSDMHAAAMKRQAGIVQELQAILGGTGPIPKSTSVAVASTLSDNAAAGPAQYMSLATGAPVATDPAAAQMLFEHSAAQHGMGYPAGHAQFMSLATGAPLATDPTALATAQMLFEPSEAQAGMENPREMSSLGPDSIAAVATAWEAVGPLSENGRAFLSDFCREGVSIGPGHNGTTNSSLHSSSSSSSWLAPAGVLTLQDAERVKGLLEELVGVDMSVKSHTQGLAVAFTNVTSTTQRAATLLASYPWFLVTPEICASIVQLDAEAKQKGKGGDAKGSSVN